MLDSFEHPAETVRLHRSREPRDPRQPGAFWSKVPRDRFYPIAVGVVEPGEARQNIVLGHHQVQSILQRLIQIVGFLRL